MRGGERPAGLSPEQAAVLAEFGYDAAYVAEAVKDGGGTEELVAMADRARRGELPPREYGTVRPVRAPRAGRPAGAAVPAGGDLRGCLLFYLLCLPVAVALIAFSAGAVVLLSRLPAGHTARYASLLPWWAAALLVAVPFALLDAAARWRGRRMLVMGSLRRRSRVATRPAELGMRPVPPGLQEAACLPLLSLIPLCVVQRAVGAPVNVPTEIVAVGLLGACAVSMVLAGGRWAVALLTAAWAGWAWTALHAPSTVAALVLLAVTVAVAVPYFQRIAHRIDHGPGHAPSGHDSGR